MPRGRPEMTPALLCKADVHRGSQVSAHDGLRVCWGCREGIERDVLDIGRIDAELLDQQAWRSVPDGPSVSGTRERSMPVRLRHADARMRIEVGLFAWAKLVIDERGLSLPARQTVQVAATIVLSSAGWLAAHPLAVECCNELRELAHGWPRSVARPSGSTRAPAGACPLCCEETHAIIRPADDERESTIVCSACPDHRWSPNEWAIVVTRHHATDAILDTISASMILRVSEASMRQFVSRGMITREAGGFRLEDLRRLYDYLWLRGA